MTTISQRELRNDNAAIMRGVEQGETYTVTRRGVPVARLTPFVDEPDLRIVKPASRPFAWADLERVRLPESTSDLLDDLRGDR